MNGYLRSLSSVFFDLYSLSCNPLRESPGPTTSFLIDTEFTFQDLYPSYICTVSCSSGNQRSVKLPRPQYLVSVPHLDGSGR